MDVALEMFIDSCLFYVLFSKCATKSCYVGVDEAEYLLTSRKMKALPSVPQVACRSFPSAA